MGMMMMTMMMVMVAMMIMRVFMETKAIGKQAIDMARAEFICAVIEQARHVTSEQMSARFRHTLMVRVQAEGLASFYQI